jgi:hypothetical protein
MKIAETCCCGASVEIEWMQTRSGTGSSEASVALDAWHRRHKSCKPHVAPPSEMVDVTILPPDQSS